MEHPLTKSPSTNTQKYSDKWDWQKVATKQWSTPSMVDWWKTVSSSDPFTIRDWDIWLLIRCMHEIEGKSKPRLDSHYMEELEEEDSDLEKCKRTAYCPMDWALSWEKDYWKWATIFMSSYVLAVDYWLWEALCLKLIAAGYARAWESFERFKCHTRVSN